MTKQNPIKRIWNRIKETRFHGPGKPDKPQPIKIKPVTFKD